MNMAAPCIAEAGDADLYGHDFPSQIIAGPDFAGDCIGFHFLVRNDSAFFIISQIPGNPAKNTHKQNQGNSSF